jgi:NADPH-dependent glutamate synthase beta subunit-like oxidoreductase
MIEEGIRIKFLAAPNRVIGKGKKVAGLECLSMELSNFDSSGRRRPVPKEGSEFAMDVDMVIAAISQVPDVSYVSNDIVAGKGNTIVVDPITLATTKPGVFAGGDAVSGPATVVEALHAGEEAAISIDKFLNGEDMKKDRLRLPPKRVDLPKAEEETKDKMRVKVPLTAVPKRVRNFDEVVKSYSLAKAREEASRCLRCDLEE